MHEHKIDKHRAGRIHEKCHSQELTVYINGPPVSKCGNIVKNAMNQYWQTKLLEKILKNGTLQGNQIM